MKDPLFGTDGIRNVANRGYLSAECVQKIGKAMGLLTGDYACAKGTRACTLIARDTRVSGDMIQSALVSGLLAMGVDVIDAGVLPTPVAAFLTREKTTTLGIMISASHNPHEYNGIKLLTAHGFKAPDSLQNGIEALVFSPDPVPDPPEERGLGGIVRDEEASDLYVRHLLTHYREMWLEGLKIVLDCANGATYRIAPRLFRELGAEVIALHTEPDGRNINLDCGALHPDVVARAVEESRAHLGLSFDGDGDRVIAADENGVVRDGDSIMAICGSYFAETGELNGNTVVATVMSNLGLEVYLRERGIRLLRTKVGDRYVSETMQEGNYVLGGEQSGHLIFSRLSNTGDGIITALELIRVLRARGERLSSLASPMKKYPQLIINVRVGAKKPFEEIDRLTARVKEAEAELGDRGRILLRYSGTEPVARVMLEGEEEDMIRRHASDIARIIEEELG
jgi:phosphoglucosamine mutase